ncbi:MAG: osmoprotectant transport system permease protein [Pseudonocardiales bacterium]|jgi:osmoprotectant transport system permease protein|nr:osmoprotectant transport system permease protein [Pseudonocardiales bacterium]MDT4970823.1 osmoprotectant transport system permease protein [Pseudonocardiales bacterium]
MSALTFVAASDLPPLSQVTVWLNDPSNWTGPNGLLFHLRQHVIYTVVAVVIALIIALPIGLLVGHTGRGAFLVGGLTNGLRAVPALGLVVLLVVWLSPKIHLLQSVPGVVDHRGALPYLIPVEIVLVLLAIPPILINTYAGVQNVDPEARDAAKGMGMTGFQVVRKVELPCALPLIMSGLRSSVLQVIATATIAAFAPFLGGLGSYIINGAQVINDPHNGYPAMVGAGLVVAALALVAELSLIVVQRYVVSPGISGRFRKSKSTVQASGGTVVGTELAGV